MGLTCEAAPEAKPLSERKVVRELTLKVDRKRGNGDGHRKEKTVWKAMGDWKVYSGKRCSNNTNGPMV